MKKILDYESLKIFLNYKVFFWIGTKGEFIKLLPVIKNFEKEGIPYGIIFTGQHTKASFYITEKFRLKVDFIFLNPREEDLSSFFECVKWWLKCLFKILFLKRRNIFEKKILIVHGDTESTLLGMIFAKYNRMILMHVEAGLRSFSIFEPFPEEIIRRIIDFFSDYLFCPEDKAVENVKKLKRKKIINTYYNTVKDTIEIILPETNSISEQTDTLGYVIVSIHRKENLYNKYRLKNILNLIYRISEDEKVFLILDKHAEHILSKNEIFLKKISKKKNIEIMKVMEYEKFLKLVQNSDYVMTDGGSLQEETFFLNKPCLILRKRTERKIGLGETAFLYSFDFNSWEFFRGNYKKLYRKKTDNLLEVKPSEIILKTVKNVL